MCVEETLPCGWKRWQFGVRQIVFHRIIECTGLQYSIMITLLGHVGVQVTKGWSYTVGVSIYSFLKNSSRISREGWNTWWLFSDCAIWLARATQKSSNRVIRWLWLSFPETLYIAHIEQLDWLFGWWCDRPLTCLAYSGVIWRDPAGLQGMSSSDCNPLFHSHRMQLKEKKTRKLMRDYSLAIGDGFVCPFLKYRI